MKKSGFTMIELIFVIVIIGILAAVAIPKLAATRTDAKIAGISQEIQSAVQEVPAYVTAQGGEANDTNFTIKSQVLKQMVGQGKATEDDSKASTANSTRYLEVYGDTDSNGKGITCITLETNDTTLFVRDSNSSAAKKGLICKGVQARIRDANYTIAGESVKF